MQTKRLEIRLPPGLADKIKALAEKEKISVNEWCTRCLDRNTLDFCKSKETGK